MEFQNSQWCVDKQGRVGMIDGINGGEVSFRYSDDLGQVGELVKIQQADLRLARFSEIPKALGYTADQARDMGYAVDAPAPKQSTGLEA